MNTKYREPLVSVIIPTHNYGCYIDECIQSVLNQEYKNLEIIVVDDESTDNTAEIVQKYPTVKYLYQKHKGNKTPARAMNKGITHSHGDFIVCLGADDKLDPKFITRCLEEISVDDKVGFVWTGTQEFGYSSNIRLPIRFRHNFRFYRNPGGQLGAMMVRKEVYEKIGLYDEFLHGLEDWDFVIRASSFGWKGNGIREILHWTRVHHGRVTAEAEKYNAKSELEAKYPLMKIYNISCRLFNILVLFIEKPKIFLIRLWNKVICKFFLLPKFTEPPSNIQHVNVNEKRIIQKVRGPFVLDCGCGIGRWGYLLKNKGYALTGIDIFKPYLKCAKVYGTYENLILGDLSYLPFKSKCFDTALCIEVIEHLQKRLGEKFLKQIKEITRKRIILTTPKYDQRVYFGEGQPETHKSYWTREEIVKCLD